MDFKTLIDANGHAEIPEGADKIPQRAFKDCKTLKSVTIPSSVSVIQRNAFEGCVSLASIIIPDSVKRIGPDCFEGCNNLKEVRLPQGIERIEEEMFLYCSALSSITIPNTVTSIGSSAFHFCRGLTNISIPDSVTAIEDNAFSGCSGLTNIIIPDFVTIIGDQAFRNCSALTSIIIPNSVTRIGFSAFSECTGLTSITIPNSLTSIGVCTFSRCSGLTNIIIPDSVTIIGDQAFRDCSALTSIIIPNSVTRIGFSAFYGCSGLTSISVPNSVTEIGRNCFENCTSLKTISLSSKVGRIDSETFRGCVSLDDIAIPEGVLEIGGDAFAGCASANISLPSTVDKISVGKKGFEVKSVTISADNKTFSVENDCVVNKIDRSVLVILPTAVSFPQDIRAINIAEDAFPNLFDVEDLAIPEGVIHIDHLPFKQMAKLKKLQLPKSMKSCGRDFMEYYHLPSISVSPELFLSDNFKAWKDINKVNLIGIDSISDELKEKIKNKYNNQKAGWKTFYTREGTGRLFWVYLNGELIHPAAHIVKKKEESIAAEELKSKKKDMSEKLEDITLSSLCAATFGNSGFDFSYRDYNNEVKVIVFDGIKLGYRLNIENAQEDLAFLLDVATSYQNAIKPYIDGSHTPCVDTRFNNEKAHYCVCGEPFPNNAFRLYLGVQSDTSQLALQALEDLSKAYNDMSQKYGKKLDDISVW